MSVRRVSRHKPAPLNPVDILTNQLRAALTTIDNTYDDTIEPVRRAIGAHVTMNSAHPPLPLAAAILDTRAAAHERAAYWAQLVQHGQHLTGLPAVDLHTLTAYLDKHAAWLAAHKWGTKALEELENSADALTQIVKDSAPHKFKVGSCPGTMNGAPCPGTITVTLRVSDDLLPSVLGCNAETPHVWSSSEWRVLERRLHMNAGAAKRFAAAIAPMRG